MNRLGLLKLSTFTQQGHREHLRRPRLGDAAHRADRPLLQPRAPANLQPPQDLRRSAHLRGPPGIDRYFY